MTSSWIPVDGPQPSTSHRVICHELRSCSHRGQVVSLELCRGMGSTSTRTQATSRPGPHRMRDRIQSG